MRLIGCFLSMMFFALSISAMTPGGVRKKFIALNFDTFFNAPSNVLAHAEALNAVPWLDGVAVTLRDVPVKTADGQTVMSETPKIMQLGHVWSREGVKDQIPYLSGIVGYPRLRDSFLLAWISPSGKQNRIAWTDNEGWARFGDNLAVLAWLAKQSGLRGLMLDPEEYSCAFQYLYTGSDRNVTFEQCAGLARQRGREVFSRVFKEFPNGVYFFLWTMEHHVRCFAERHATDPKGLSDDAGELLTYFYNGMLDVMPPTVRFVDGAEHYSLTATKDMYWKGALNQLVGARAFVAPENWAKYRSQLLVGNTHYLDMFSKFANPRSWWYHGPVEGSRLNHLRRNLEQSLQVADEYIWIYGETGRLIDWKCSVTKYQNATERCRLWEEQIPGFTETLMMAKDPDAFLEMRKKEYAEQGRLKNLVEGCGAVPARFCFPDEGKEFVSKTTRSVKGIKAGEVYEVGQEIRAGMKDGLPSIKVSWHSKGKCVAENTDVQFKHISGRPNDWSWMRGVVTVPEGVDELVLSFAAFLKPGETATARRTEIFRVKDAAAVMPSVKNAVRHTEKKRNGGKWFFDEKSKLLSDGNWSLAASFEKGDSSGKSLSVSGKKSAGSGVLDFSDVEKDTGKKIVSVSGFTRNTSITGFVGPDVERLGMDAFRFCGNLRRVSLSPNLKVLATSSLAYCTNLVEFAPLRLPADVQFAGISQFQGCSSLKAGFVYEGNAALPEKMFADSGITSLSAPNCTELKRGSLSGCRNLAVLSFAANRKFGSESERFAFVREARAKSGMLVNLMDKKAKPFDNLKAVNDLHVMIKPRPSVKGVRPGELYGVSVSCRKTAYAGTDFFRVKWLKKGKQLAWETERPFAMKGMRGNGIWRSGSVLVRVPAEADELVLEAGATVKPGETFEFDKVEIFKLGEPLPVWPAEFEREKGAR